MRFLAATLAFLFLLTPAWAAPKFPALTGRVVDNANILSDATKSDLTEKLAALEAKTSRQLVVVTDFLAEAGPETQVLSDLADLRLLQTNDEAEVAPMPPGSLVW